MTENHMARVMGHKPDTKFKDKYTGAIFTVTELNEGFVKPTMFLPNGPAELEKLIPWFERWQLINE